jgi:hypothetical protein
MTIRGFLSAALLALTLSACQTASGPAPDAAALLAQLGFTAGSADDFNKDLQPDDLRTTAVYMCDTGHCGGVSLVLFATDPEGSRTQKDMELIASRGRSEGVRTANRILRSAGLTDLRVVNIAAPSTADGSKIYSLELRGSIQKERIYGRVTFLYRNGLGRLVIAMSPNRVIAARFGGLEMLR